jgi:glycosyltransferase involved in cell wall biosynthesis
VPIYVAVVLKARRRKIPIVMIYYSHAHSQKYKNALITKIRSWIYNKADLVITFGDHSMSSVKAMGVANQKILSLFNPVDVSWYHEYSISHRKSEDKGHRYLYVGQLIERKNVKSLIQAFTRMRKESDTLTIVGDGEELIQSGLSDYPALIEALKKLELDAATEFIDKS